MKIDSSISISRYMIKPNSTSWGRAYSSYIYKTMSPGHYRLMFVIISATYEHNEFLNDIFSNKSLQFINGTVGIEETQQKGSSD